MTYYIFVLCLVQGVGEFLPISSSAHLAFISLLFQNPSTSLEWEVALHLGTLISVIFYFRKEIWNMVITFLKFIMHKNRRILVYDPDLQMVFYLVTATLPAVVVGYLFKNKITNLNLPIVMGSSSIFFGLLLYWADTHLERRPQKLTLAKSFLIGCAQILAFIPGASRSGTCITAARYLNISRMEATQFAFLLSIPTVLGAVVLTGYDIYKQHLSLDWGIMVKAIILTALIGILVIHGLLLFLKRHNFKAFMIYRIIFGLGLVLLEFYSWF